MSVNLVPDPSVTQLPVQVRPLPREGTDAFIVRLAHANHLKVGYLRDYLCEPPHHKGAPSFSRLGAATGRDPAALRDTLEGTSGTCKECDAPLPATKSGARSPRQHCSARCRQRAHRRRHRPDQSTQPRQLACEFCAKPIAETAEGEARRWCSSRCRHRARLQPAGPTSSSGRPTSPSKGPRPAAVTAAPPSTQAGPTPVDTAPPPAVRERLGGGRKYGTTSPRTTA